MYYSYNVILYSSYRVNSYRVNNRYGVYRPIETFDDTKESYKIIKYLKNKHPNKEIDMRTIVSKYRNIEMVKEDNPYYKEVTSLDSIKALEERIEYDDTMEENALL